MARTRAVTGLARVASLAEALERELPAAIQEQIEIARRQDGLSQIDEIAVISAATFHAFLSKVEAATLTAEQAALIQQLGAEAQRALVAAHTARYQRENLIRRSDVLAILLQIDTRSARLVRREIARSGPDLEKRLIDGLAEVIKTAILGTQKL